MSPPGVESILAPMRGLEIPDGVSWWPVAMGWWLLLLLSLLLLLGLGHRLYRRFAPRREALGLLNGLARRYRETGDLQHLAMGVSMLLKRVALVKHPRESVAGLGGVPWMAFLDRHGGDGVFGQEELGAMAEVAYGSGKTIDGERLILQAERWIRHNA
jgi:hypothetical protein